MLFIQLPQAIWKRNYPLYIIHILSQAGSTGPFEKGNEEINQLLIENVLETSKCHKKIMLIVKV